MLDDSFADGEGQVDAGKGSVALLEIFDNAQGVEIVIERKIVSRESFVEGAFSGMSERRVADIVDEGQGFDEVFVEVEGAGNGSCDLGDFQGVGETAAEVVREAAGEDLRFAGEATEGTSVQDTVAVALKWTAEGVGWFGMGTKRLGG